MLTRLSVFTVFIPNLYGLSKAAWPIFITFLSIVSVIDTKTQTSKSAGKTNNWPTKSKNTIGDGGSTTLYTVYTVYTFYTIQTALHCLNSSKYVYIYYILEG